MKQATSNKTQDQVLKELNHVLIRVKPDAWFENAFYFHYYSEITEYDLDRLEQLGFAIKGISPKLDENKIPYLQIYIVY